MPSMLKHRDDFSVRIMFGYVIFYLSARHRFDKRFNAFVVL